MALRDVVTRGYGNGVFSPGVSKVVTRGYTVAAVVIIGPGMFAEGDVYLTDFMQGQITKPKFAEGDLDKPGFASQEDFA